MNNTDGGPMQNKRHIDLLQHHAVQHTASHTAHRPSHNAQHVPVRLAPRVHMEATTWSSRCSRSSYRFSLTACYHLRLRPSSMLITQKPNIPEVFRPPSLFPVDPPQGGATAISHGAHPQTRSSPDLYNASRARRGERSPMISMFVINGHRQRNPKGRGSGGGTSGPRATRHRAD